MGTLARLLFAWLLLLLIGLDRPLLAQVSFETFYPLLPGNRWVYEIKADLNPPADVLDIAVEEVRATPDGPRTVLSVRRLDAGMPTGECRAAAYRTEAGDFAIEPVDNAPPCGADILIPLFTYGPVDVAVRDTTVFVGRQPYTVGATFKATRISSASDSNTFTSITSFLAADIGVVEHTNVRSGNSPGGQPTIATWKAFLAFAHIEGFVYGADPVGVERPASSPAPRIFAFPQPFRDRLEVHVADADDLRDLALYDLQGRRIPVTMTSATERAVIMSIPLLAHGVYLLRVVDGAGRTAALTLVHR